MLGSQTSILIKGSKNSILLVVGSFENIKSLIDVITNYCLGSDYRMLFVPNRPIENLIKAVLNNDTEMIRLVHKQCHFTCLTCFT